MKIELGGIVKKDDWTVINNDVSKDIDIYHDISKFPYPIENNIVDEVKMFHTLEHFPNHICKRIMAEIYRIGKAFCIVNIEVPYWKRDMWTNPEHQTYFKPQWFGALNPYSGKYRNMEKWCPYNFKLIESKWITGKHAFWRKYSLKIKLQVIK